VATDPEVEDLREIMLEHRASLISIAEILVRRETLDRGDRDGRHL